MVKEIQPAVPLIAETDTAFAESLKKDAELQGEKPLVTCDPGETTKILTEGPTPLSAIFLSPQLRSPCSVPLIQLAVKNHPATPIFFLTSRQNAISLTPEELQSLTIRKVLYKPLTYKALLAELDLWRRTFSPEEALKIAQLNKDVIGAEIDDAADNFSPIRADRFFSGSSSLFDVYVKLGSGRFVKILQAGEAFESTRLSNYIQKGVKEFYLRKEAQEQYLLYSDRLCGFMLKKEGLSDSARIRAVSNHGDQVAQFFRDSGVSEQGVAHARKFAGNVIVLVERLQPHGGSALTAFLSDLNACEHAVGCAMVASMILPHLGFITEKNIQTIGVAAMLHDIALIGEDAVIRAEDEKKMNAKQLAIYHEHPRRGWKLLSTIPGIEDTVLQVVLQHHERRDRLGFPNRLGMGAINVTSELIGLSDEFARIITAVKAEPKLNLGLEIHANILPRFSAQVGDAFKQAFPKV